VRARYGTKQYVILGLATDYNFFAKVVTKRYGIVNKLFWKGVYMLQALIGPVSGLLDKFIPDADEKAKLAHEIATMAERQAHELSLAQIEVNKAEAASGSLFRGGWRPFIGWVCGIAFAYHFVIQPFLLFIVALTGATIPMLPEFDMSTLMTVLGGLIGLGGLRTFEKYKGVSK
jgi:hypothetical protein